LVTLCGAPLFGRFSDHIGQVDKAAHQLELSVVNEQGQVGLRDGHALDSALGAFAVDRGDPSMCILHIEHGILHRPSFHELEVERRGLVDRIEERQEPGRVGSDLVDDRVELDEVPGALRHPAADDVDELTEADLQLSRSMPSAVTPAFRLATWPWWSAPKTSMTRSNLRTRNLSAVVREIACEVGDIAVRPDQHTVAGVADLGGPEPDRPVVLVHEPRSRNNSIVSPTWPLSSIEACEYHSSKQMSSLSRSPYVLEDCLAGKPAGLDDVLGPLVLLRQLRDVLALVALLRHNLAAASGEKALAEKADLAASIVHVELRSTSQPHRLITRPRASPYEPSQPLPTCSGPVGLADTNSIWTRSRLRAPESRRSLRLQRRRP